MDPPLRQTILHSIGQFTHSFPSQTPSEPWGVLISASDWSVPIRKVKKRFVRGFRSPWEPPAQKGRMKPSPASVLGPLRLDWQLFNGTVRSKGNVKHSWSSVYESRPPRDHNLKGFECLLMNYSGSSVMRSHIATSILTCLLIINRQPQTCDVISLCPKPVVFQARAFLFLFNHRDALFIFFD